MADNLIKYANRISINYNELLKKDRTVDKQYASDINQFPIMTKEELLKELKKFKNGDLNAKNRIVEGNLRFVITVAKTFIDRSRSFDFLDLIQEGNLGLMRAVETYNPELGTFTTYAQAWIYQYIDNSLKKNDANIKISANLQKDKNKYLKLVNECKKQQKELPEDKKICELLRISSKQLKNIRESYLLNTISINNTLIESDEFDHEEKNSYDITYYEQGYNKVNNNLDTHILFLILKENLSLPQYYVLYYTVLNYPTKTLEEVGNNFHITRERVRQIQLKALNKSQEIIKNQFQYYSRIRNKYKNNLEKINNKPIEPESIIKYLYAQEHLNSIEKKLLYLVLIVGNNYSIEDYCNDLMCNEQDYIIIKETLTNKLKSIFSDKEKYLAIKDLTIQNYKIKIYKQLKSIELLLEPTNSDKIKTK